MIILDSPVFVSLKLNIATLRGEELCEICDEGFVQSKRDKENFIYECQKCRTHDYCLGCNEHILPNQDLCGLCKAEQAVQNNFESNLDK